MSEAENVEVSVRNVKGVSKEKETREKLSEDMKDYAKSTMNELLGMFGYEEDVSREAVDELNLKEIPMEEGGDSPEKSEEVPDEYDDDDGALPSMVATTSRITSSDNVETETTVVALPDGKGNSESVGMEGAQEHRTAEVVIPSAGTESIQNPSQVAMGAESNSTTTGGNKQEPERATPVFAHPATSTINGMYCVIAHMPCIESKGKSSVALKFWNCILCSNYFLQKPEIVFRVEQPYLFIHQPQWLYQAALCQSCCRIIKPASWGSHRRFLARNQSRETRIDGAVDSILQPNGLMRTDQGDCQGFQTRSQSAETKVDEQVDSILQANGLMRTDQGDRQGFQTRSQSAETIVDEQVDSILQANARMRTGQGVHQFFQSSSQSVETRVVGQIDSILQADKRCIARPANAQENHSNVMSKHTLSVEVRKPKFILPKPACLSSSLNTAPVTNISISSCEGLAAKEDVYAVCSIATSASVVQNNDCCVTCSKCTDSVNDREGLCSEKSEVTKTHFQCSICSRYFNKASKQCGLSKVKFPNLFPLSLKEMDRIQVCVKCFSRLNRQRDRFEAAGIPEGSRNYFAYIKLWTGNETKNLVSVKNETIGGNCFICERELVGPYEFARNLQRWKYPSLFSRLKENASVCSCCYKKMNTLRMKFEKASIEEDKREYAEFINSWRKQKGLDSLNI